jgi:hypothetical protein
MDDDRLLSAAASSGRQLDPCPARLHHSGVPAVQRQRPSEEVRVLSRPRTTTSAAIGFFASGLLMSATITPPARAADPLPKDELVKQGDAICMAVAARVTETSVKVAGTPFFSIRQIPKVVPRLLPLYASEISRLTALQPADTESSAVSSLLVLMKQRLTLMRSALADAQAKRWAAIDAVHNKRVTLYHREKQIAHNLGFVFCPTA